jgi:hypothetical protein
MEFIMIRQSKDLNSTVIQAAVQMIVPEIYGVEIWIVTKAERDKILIAETKFLRVVKGYTRITAVTNEKLGKK